MTQAVDLSEVEFVPVDEIPNRKWVESKWLKFFDELPDGEAALFKYNNRQRAHQVRGVIFGTLTYHKITGIHTRIIHGTKEIHGTDEWLLYVWKTQTTS